MLGLVACLLCACNHEDTASRALWGRSLEPRLTMTRTWSPCKRSLARGRVVATAQCAARPLDNGRCDEPAPTREDALRILVTRPRCATNAIRALERMASSDPAAASDLAAAYYVRAQRDDNATDLLRALPFAQRAVAANPIPPGAQFNLALILEALDLNDDALEIWNILAQGNDGPWAAEARTHRDAVRRKLSIDGDALWQQTRARIETALANRDSHELDLAVRSYPASSERYFEATVLTQWAAKPSRDTADRVTALADALARATGDPFTSDVARSVTADHSESAAASLRNNILELQQSSTPAEHLAAQFGAAGCPLQFSARLQAANSQLLSDAGAALSKLDDIMATRGVERYPLLVARVQLNRLTALEFRSRIADALEAHDIGAALAEAHGDWETSLALHGRHSGLTGLLGMKDLAFRSALESVRGEAAAASLNTRHVAVGAAAYAATDLNATEAAFLYMSRFIRRLQRRLAGELPAKLHHTYEASLVSALRQRASIELRLNHNAEAARDLDEARRFLPENDALRKALEARLAEVEGLLQVAHDPSTAVGHFTRAIALASGSEYATYVALLYVERSRAWAALAHGAQAENDLRYAIHTLAGEEKALLGSRNQKERDKYWDAYFSRFSEAYDLLIRNLVEQGRTTEALQYAERARAAEAVDLILKSNKAPATFRQLAANPPLDIAALQRQIPSGTYLVEYRVLDDVVYAWIVSRDTLAFTPVEATRRDVRRWEETLQEAVVAYDRSAFEDGLLAPYRLLARPLALIRAAAGHDHARIVVIPDDALHGLPFAALRNPVTRQFLVEEHPVAISGSALLYAFSVLRDGDLTSSDTSLLAVGNPAFDPAGTLTRGLTPLPAAMREVGEIVRIYARGDTLTGAAATSARFLELVPGRGIVHIAAHAVATGGPISQAYVVLTPADADPGIIDAAKLRSAFHTGGTRLVVLGACSSSGGAPVGAEGVAPLVRPLIAAGVPGIIGSLWDVRDATAAEVLVSFHRHYHEGMDAAAALQAAQLEMLRSSNAGLASALTWAPFQAIGVASSPFAHKQITQKEKPP